MTAPEANPPEPAIEDRYLFVHIPKTAGTSFRVFLERSFPPGEIYPNAEDLEAAGGVYRGYQSGLASLSNKRRMRLRLISGHLPSAAARTFDPPAQTIVVLREPVARALSNLRQLAGRALRHSPALMANGLTGLLDDDGIRLHAIADRQVRFLSYSGGRDLLAWPSNPRILPGAEPPFPITEERLERALKAVQDAALVGVSEQLEATARLCRATLGIGDGLPGRENVTPQQDDAEPALLERLEELVQYDRVLYEEAVRLFSARCEQAGIAVDDPRSTGSLDG